MMKMNLKETNSTNNGTTAPQPQAQASASQPAVKPAGKPAVRPAVKPAVKPQVQRPKAAASHASAVAKPDMSKVTPEIISKLSFKMRVACLQNELNAPKSKYNSFSNYSYRTTEDIIEAAKPLCFKYHVVLTITDDIVVVGDRFYVKTTARLDDTKSDESISASAFAREATEKKGFDPAQITGSASSYARKYALNGLLMIDDSDSKDTDTYRN